ncbi:calcium-activated potassium channel subunit alpha-1-like [Osmerus mordax]|uniref:calcium-activated potassium channel subunit alpha-1-like n=1 Tax=Osmerus mordax TaxID=8014 RepID=UPI00350F713E
MYKPRPFIPEISYCHCMYRGTKIWDLYSASCLVTLVQGVLLILLRKWTRPAVEPRQFLPQDQHQAHLKCITPPPQLSFSSLMDGVTAQASTLISREHPHGRFLTVLMFVLNMGSFVMYLVLTTRPVEYCVEGMDALLLLDLAFDVLYLLHFWLRFLSAQDLMVWWLNYKTIADIFTVAPACFTVVTGRAWLGLRFLRALYILELPAILQMLNILTSKTSQRLCRLGAILMGTLFFYAGLIHLVESAGDPWLENSNALSRPYFLYVYFLTVTMSTVGYGDVLVITASGQFLITVFIFIYLGMFASFIPQMMEILANRKRFNGAYSSVLGKSHVVVCGHLSLSNIEPFVREFFHDDRGEVNTNLLFLGDFCPDATLEEFFASLPGQIYFYQGSVQNRQDQDRVMMRKASACVILSDRFAVDPDAEDSDTLMNVISVKTYHPNTRVIVQMLKPSNKVIVQKIPDWDWSCGDAALCPMELKLGFMAKSCLVPGLSTLLANLFTMQGEVEQRGDSWKNLYMEGMYNEIYTEHFSWPFRGMSFAQASKLCFLKLGLLLIGIATYSEDDEMSVLVNPPKCIKIKRGTLGFLVASDSSDARRASIYCERCHSRVRDPCRMSPCQCPEFQEGSSLTSVMNLRRPSLGVLPSIPDLEEEGDWTKELETEGQVTLDSTGLFHWCSPVSLEEVTLTREMASGLALQKHVVACVFGDGHSRLLGLRAFMMPLRASSLTRPELPTVIFLGDTDYFLREWPDIHYFPHVYFLPVSVGGCGGGTWGSPVCLDDLLAAGVTHCARTVILNSTGSTKDTQTVLSCYTLNSLSLQTEDLSPQTDALTTLSLSSNYQGPHSPCQKTTRESIPLLVEIDNTSNVKLMNETEGLEEADSLPLTEVFSQGKVFSVDVLDSLMAAMSHQKARTYFNSNVPLLVSTLVTGGDSPLLETQLLEDNHLTEGAMTSELWALRRRSKLAQLALQEQPLCRLQCVLFRDLFCQALDSLEILCFGLYRLIDPPNRSMKRFVITNPQGDLPLLASDRVFCSVPFHQSHLLTQSHPV